MSQALIPAYMRIRHYVLDWLSSTEGLARKLPSSREIAVKFNVSQPTVIKALQELIAEKYLVNRPRVGIFSNPDRVSVSKKKLWGIVLGDGCWSYMTGEATMIIYQATAELLRRNSSYRLKIITMGETINEAEGWPELTMLSGIVWWTPPENMFAAISKLAQNLPVTVIGRRCPGVPCFHIDYEAENYRITRQMIADGCRKILLVRPDTRVDTAIRGVAKACQEANFEFPPAAVISNQNAGLRDLEQLIKLNWVPDAIIFNSSPEEFISLLNTHPELRRTRCYCDQSEITDDWKFRGYAGKPDYQAIASVIADYLEVPERADQMKFVLPLTIQPI